MNKTVTDIDLSLMLSVQIAEEYLVALEFIQSNPDYSLMKFRELANVLAERFAEAQNISFNNEKLADKIQALHQAQLINSPQKEALNRIRKLGNLGVHQTYGSFEDGQFYQQRKALLHEKAVEARKHIVSLFEDLALQTTTHMSIPKVEFISLSEQNYKELLFRATLSSSYKEKLTAGIVVESIHNDQALSSPAAVSSEVYFHSSSLIQMSAALYQAAYRISAKVDKYPDNNLSDEESYIRHHCALEPLYRYAAILLTGNLEKQKEEEALVCLNIAAERGYIPAMAMLGAFLYEEHKFEQAFNYLSRSANADNSTALRFLYYYYSDGLAVTVNETTALQYLQRAVDMECPDAIATLGEAYHKGIAVVRNEQKAKQLLEQSVQKGSLLGKQYLSFEFSHQQNKMKTLEQVTETLMNMQHATSFNDAALGKTKKVGANDPCPCGSGLKYKKCCR